MAPEKTSVTNQTISCRNDLSDEARDGRIPRVETMAAHKESGNKIGVGKRVAASTSSGFGEGD